MARDPASAISKDSKRKNRGNSSTAKSRVSGGTKRRVSGGTKLEVQVKPHDVPMQTSDYGEIDEPAQYKRQKRASASSNFKEKSPRLSRKSPPRKSSLAEAKRNHVVEEEEVAVKLTNLGPEDNPPSRKVVDFVLHDADGNPQPFEMTEFNDFFVTALIMPMDDGLEKETKRGVKCECFGRIETWSISGYDEGTPVVWISTEIADYECVKPASNYKRYYDHFHEKALICVEVYRKLARSAGGNPDLTLEELLASVIRSMSGTKNFSCGSFSRGFIISIGDFIYNQLIGLDEDSNKNDAKLATLPALVALRDECKKGMESKDFYPPPSNASLKIKEGGSCEVNEDEDEKLARLLQEEENWKSRRQLNPHQPSSFPKNIYIKISEAEIANDYPLPAFYKTSVEEMDEYIFFESENSVTYSDLPTRILNNWSLYNSDSRLIPLELLPMETCAETDVAIFGSGSMKDDDGSGYFVDVETTQSSTSSSSSRDDDGVAVYLSAIKEWVIEFGSLMIFISIRTDVAWYRLGKPSKQYSPWYETVLKIIRLGISIIALLSEQTRTSKLSFADVIKKVSEFDKDHPGHVSCNLASVERYIVAHGQIILQQLAQYPDERIRRCAFVTALADRMAQMRHTKLVMNKKVVVQKEANLNPRASMAPLLSKRKVMRATTTKLINRIWGEYYSSYFPEDTKEENGHEPKDDLLEEEQAENEEDEVEDDNSFVLDKKTRKSYLSTHTHVSRSSHKKATWKGDPTGKLISGELLYNRANIPIGLISVGGKVMLEANEIKESPPILFIEYMFEKQDGTKMAHGRVLQKGSETVLGNAANEREVFLTNECLDFELLNIKEFVAVDMRSLSWRHDCRKDNADFYMKDKAKAEERKKNGLSIEYYCKSVYCPERGAFFTLPSKSLGLGTGVCNYCQEKEALEDEFRIISKDSFFYNTKEYNVQDFVYVSPQFFSAEKEERGTFKSGRNVGLKAYVVCHLLEVEAPESSEEPTPQSTLVKVRRFYKPENVSSEKAYCSDIREVYYSEEIVNVSVDMLEGKCEVRRKSDIPIMSLPVVTDHVFFCEYSYDVTKGTVKQLPANVKSAFVTRRASRNGKNKGKEKCQGDRNESTHWNDAHLERRLATLDIFAGCGGLSEGLQRSGASFTKWAIEYEQPAGEAFGQNHPEAKVFIDNCNVILRAIMEKCGDVDDCISTSEAAELASKLDEDKRSSLPLPGQVDFINGGPPCQGFSGMNRFNHSTWSKVQCEMILAFLSFAEYFRPKFFLLENVRNFVSFNKGQTFRLTVASLLEIGYQVRFGILEAGAFGVSQSRKRAFIWAAAPDELLPEWPEPMQVFASPELKINLPNNEYYAAARSTAGGAPFRSTTVRDTIGDLPSVDNGASDLIMDYKNDAVSWFQKQIRGDTAVLSDHISKEMNELNLIRCQRIPKRPGSDWHDLPDEKVKLSNGQTVDLIPWCLPNTASRHNQWKGLFGRLDWEGNFPTSITDPQPMGKVGMCFHPDQDRILTVRECARSQGFPDSYKFCGNIQNKHRQIGNAVPPPLAYALGRKLKEAIDLKARAN